MEPCVFNVIQMRLLLIHSLYIVQKCVFITKFLNSFDVCSVCSFTIYVFVCFCVYINCAYAHHNTYIYIFKKLYIYNILQLIHSDVIEKKIKEKKNYKNR